MHDMLPLQSRSNASRTLVKNATTRKLPNSIAFILLAITSAIYKLRDGTLTLRDLQSKVLRNGEVTRVVEGQKSCFPPRDGRQLSLSSNATSVTTANTVVYMELAWFNFHSETFYSFINYFCSCHREKYRTWVLKNDTYPIFYMGVEGFVRPDLQRILEEFNKTSCGPIIIGTPPETSIDITLHTTSYPGDFGGEDSPYKSKVNDPKHIFICHGDAPTLEDSSNVFFLTPLHKNYIVPSYFPPTIVQLAEQRLDRHPNPAPVFLVLGSFNDAGKRNTHSLKPAIAAQRDKNFTIHFLGGESNNEKNETLNQFVKSNFNEDYIKIKLTPNTEADVFMSNVGNADVILPLVDETNFYSTYQGGKKLTSAISWGLGFHKRLLVYRPLAAVFGIQELAGLYWVYDNSTHFSTVFANCLSHLLNKDNEH